MKICYTCKQEKELYHFRVNNATKDKLDYHCIACRKEKYIEKYGRAILLTEEEKRKRRRERRLAYARSWGSGVYILHTECGGTYIGSSKTIRVRKDRHSSTKKRSDSRIAGYFKVVKFQILENLKNPTLKDLKAREQYWIEKLQPTLNSRSAKQ